MASVEVTLRVRHSRRDAVDAVLETVDQGRIAPHEALEPGRYGTDRVQVLQILRAVLESLLPSRTKAATVCTGMVNPVERGML